MIKYNKGVTPIMIFIIIMGILMIAGGTYYFKLKNNFISENTENIINKNKSSNVDNYTELLYKKDYPTDNIFSVYRGSISGWINISKDFLKTGRDYTIFHTDDSRYALYLDTFISPSLGLEIKRIAARAGGNERDPKNNSFPEASIIINNEGKLDDYKTDLGWYAPVRLPALEWHLINMTWNGYPDGKVTIYLDGNLIGEKEYNSDFNNNKNLPTKISIGYRPNEWLGDKTGFVPVTDMDIKKTGIQVKDLRLYQKVLSEDEIKNIKLSGIPNRNGLIPWNHMLREFLNKLTF